MQITCHGIMHEKLYPEETNGNPEWFSTKRPIDVPEGTAFDAWTLRIKSLEEFESLDARKKLLYFSWFGALAPTTHNTVPQRFRLHPQQNSVDLFIDRGTPEKPIVLPASDPVGRQASVSLGCAIEHMVLAARSYGINSFLTINEEAEEWIKPPQQTGAQHVPVASIKFNLDQGNNLENISFLPEMLTRKSERKPFSDSIPIPNHILTHLIDAARQDGVTLHAITNKIEKGTLGLFQSMADTFVVNNSYFARELGDWLLPNDSENTIGMRGREFGFDDKTAEKYSLGLQGKEHLNVQDLMGFSLGGKSLMKDSSAIFAITVPTDNLRNRIIAGQVFDYSSLYLNRHGFSTSMHAGITEVDSANKMFAATLLHTRERPTVVFRVGKPIPEASENRPHSSRPPLEDLILE